MKILNVRWFCSQSTVGIVLCENDFNQTKAYIGTGVGLDEQYDAHNIANWGAKIDKTMAEAVFGRKLDNYAE